jgi:hypothetical protein
VRFGSCRPPENLVAGETPDDRINNPPRLRLFPPLGAICYETSVRGRAQVPQQRHSQM